MGSGSYTFRMAPERDRNEGETGSRMVGSRQLAVGEILIGGLRVVRGRSSWRVVERGWPGDPYSRAGY